MDFKVKKFNDDYPLDIIINIRKESALDYQIQKRISWAYHNNVYGKPKLWLLKDKKTGEYFGTSALLPRKCSVMGRTCQGSLIADTALKTRYRSLGLF